MGVKGGFMRILSLVLAFLLLGGVANATSYIYISQEKEINGSYKYCIPKLELNKTIRAGELFGTKVNYLSEFEGALIYTAPRNSALSLNHHSVQANWNFGIELGNLFATYSLGGRVPIAGNSDGLTQTELFNLFSAGMRF